MINRFLHHLMHALAWGLGALTLIVGGFHYVWLMVWLGETLEQPLRVIVCSGLTVFVCCLLYALGYMIFSPEEQEIRKDAARERKNALRAAEIEAETAPPQARREDAIKATKSNLKWRKRTALVNKVAEIWRTGT